MEDNKKYVIMQGQNFAFIIHGNNVFNFKNPEEYSKGENRLKLIIYPNSIIRDLCNNKDKIKKVDFKYLSTPNSVCGGWYPDDKESDGYISINPKEGEYGTCYVFFVWNETQLLDLGSYTMEIVLATGNGISRMILKQSSMFSVNKSIGACINENFSLN